jgi:ATPase family associated with various cellular activities (AAA)
MTTKAIQARPAATPSEVSSFLNRIRSGYAGGRPRTARRNRVKAAAGSKRTLKGYTFDHYDDMTNLKEYMSSSDNNKVFMGVSDFSDLITTEILQKRVDANKQTLHRETTVLANRKAWAEWSEEEFEGCLFVQASASSGFIVEEEDLNYVTYSVNSNSTTVRAFGDEVFVEYIIDLVTGKFDIVTSYIEWIYSSDGNSVNVPLNRDRLPVDEMYPFLNGEKLTDYYDRFMESSANILLLIGPPGTGKTTFIRGLLSHTESSAMVTYDAAILEKDYLFARFIEDDTSVMVLEDSDAFLKSRSDGNTMMHRFLNVGDGLVTTKGKKMIFSTNLPSIRDIDSALVRPGRCFDIVTFDNLTLPQAQTLADKLNVSLPAKPRGKETEKYSIAEVFHVQQNQPTATANRKVGFI